MMPWKKGALIVACGLALAACAAIDNDRLDAVGSRLSQPPPNSPPMQPIDAGDVAIVGQDVANAILALPDIANATVPPIAQFNGVTSIMNQPIDTQPYTTLLRDRLLLITREKLRFVEHTLPAYMPKHHHEDSSIPSNPGGSPDYQVLAEMRGHVEADYYKIQVEFVDLRSNQILFNALYRIRPEADSGPPPEEIPNPAPEPTMETSTPQAAPPPPAPSDDLTQPTTSVPQQRTGD